MRVLAGPSRYIQGKDALFEHAKELLSLGHQPLLLCDSRVFDLVGERFIAYLTRYGMRVTDRRCDGIVSENAITHLLAEISEQRVDMIIGLGGGETMDRAKVLADILALPLVAAPTLASTGAPTSPLSVIYTDEGAIENYRHYGRSADLVLVDSAVIAQAPRQLLASGIANALASQMDGHLAQQPDGSVGLGTSPSLATLALGRQCQQTLFTDGRAAMQACEQQRVTPALDNIIEANILLSGLSGGSVAFTLALAIGSGLTALAGDRCHLTHGEKIAYGTLVELQLENRPLGELNRYICLYQAIEMPTTLAEFHLETAHYDDLLRVGQQAILTAETIHHLSMDVTAAAIAQAILAVDQHVRSLDQ